MSPQTVTTQMLGTFAAHGITSGLLAQLQHIQELALAINLQGEHLIHYDVFGLGCGPQQVTIAGCPRESRWRAGIQRTPSYLVEIPAGGDATALREVQRQLANAVADLAALLEEDAACASSST